MRDDWTETSLGDIAEVLDRMRRPISAAEREKRPGKVPYYGATGQAGWIDKPIFDEELVLLGEDAIDFLNPDVHKAYLISGPSWVNNHAHVLKPRTAKVIPFFLMESLNAVDYSQFVVFGTRSKLTQGSMMGISVNLPPIAEQKRIVDVVSSVDAYIDALQQQVAAARRARNAVLHELLTAGGDDWTETTLGEVLSIQSGFAFSTNDWADDGYPVIKINNVRDGRVSTESCSFISDPIPKGSEKFRLSCGDLLITLTGEIGATGTVHQDFPMYLNQRVGKITVLDSSRVLLNYLAVHFNYQPVRDEMWSLGKGNAQLNISPKSIHEMQVNLPPIAEQRRIVGIVSSMDGVIQAAERAVVEAKNLRSGLLSDLLSGEHEIPVSYDELLGAA